MFLVSLKQHPLVIELLQALYLGFWKIYIFQKSSTFGQGGDFEIAYLKTLKTRTDFWYVVHIA